MGRMETGKVTTTDPATVDLDLGSIVFQHLVNIINIINEYC